MREKLAGLDQKLTEQTTAIARLKLEKDKIDMTSQDVQKQLAAKGDKLKMNQSTLIELQREDCRQSMREQSVEIVDDIGRGYWRRQNSSSEEDEETESEVALSMPKQF